MYHFFSNFLLFKRYFYNTPDYFYRIECRMKQNVLRVADYAKKNWNVIDVDVINKNFVLFFIPDSFVIYISYGNKVGIAYVDTESLFSSIDSDKTRFRIK